MTFLHGNDGHLNNLLRQVDNTVHGLESGFRGGFNYEAVYREIDGMHRRSVNNGVFDAGLFRLQVNEMDYRFHRDGYLPKLHIRLDDNCNPLLVPDLGFGPMTPGHRHFGPFRMGHYLNRHHHLPPAPLICSDAASGAGPCPPAEDADCQVVADDAASQQSTGPASVPDSPASMPVSNPYRFASYGGGSGDTIPAGTSDAGPVTDQSTQQSSPEISGASVLQPAETSTSTVGGDASPQAAGQSDRPETVPVAKVPDSQLTMSGAPTITPEKIDEVLRSYHSPAAGMGQYVYDQGVKRGINPAMALAFYCVESQCGTKGLAVQNKSWGNVRGHGPHGYRPYDSIKESLDKWYDMIGDLYLNKFHADKLAKVVSHYAPNSDGNDEAGYVRSVGQLVRKWQC